MGALTAYLESAKEPDPGMCAYVANLDVMQRVSAHTAARVVNELADQRSNLKLIASENYSSLATQLAMGNLLTDKYAEGHAHHRFYAGCDNVDAIEAEAAEAAKRLFGAEYAYVQPHSGADANLIAYWAILHTRVGDPAIERLGGIDPSKMDHKAWEQLRHELGNQRLLALDYYSGGHITHGYRHNVSAQMFDAYSYGVDRETGLLDYEDIWRQAMEIKPLILLTGFSAYPRSIDFARLRAIADEAGSVFMVDMAHFAGLVAGKVFQGDHDPLAHAHVVTTTTHKTLRGPRGGMVLSTSEFAPALDKGCPLVIGGPLPHVMAAKAIAFEEAEQASFRDYAVSIVKNSKALADALTTQGITLATAGTDNHLMLIDVRPLGLTGRQAESALRECGITLNRNSLPYDPNGPWYTSGLRMGTPAVSSLGMGTSEMVEIASIIADVLKATTPSLRTKGDQAGTPSRARYQLSGDVKAAAKSRVEGLLGRFPVYPELDLEFLQKHFPLNTE